MHGIILVPQRREVILFWLRDTIRTRGAERPTKLHSLERGPGALCVDACVRIGARTSRKLKQRANRYRPRSQHLFFSDPLPPYLYDHLRY